MSRRRSVFLICGEVDLCLLMKTYFLRKNYEVYIAHTLSDGMLRLPAYQPDVVLLDTVLFDNPEEAIAQIKTACPYAEIVTNNFTV